MSVFFEKKKVVVPGETLAEGQYKAGYGTYKVKDLIKSSIVGLPDIKNNYITVIPLQGAYIS
ncbi:MAG: hypothetical protein HWN66_15085 [Candidatus Helarchaeota archaeon]|nr:hypothetical protein [Candidatus Helarchaeota archaeon]